jgi:hypothetical protein
MRFGKLPRLALSGLALALGLASQPALAYDWMVETTISAIEPTYVPSSVNFTVNAPAGTCAMGAWLSWNVRGADQPSRIANAQAILSILLTAKMSGKTIRIYGNNAGCTVDFMHFLP